MKTWMRSTVAVAVLVLAAAAGAQERFVAGPAAQRAGSGEYRVRLALMPGDDAAAVAGQLEATYGLQLARVGEGAEWTVVASESRARLLSADPHVEAVTSSPAREITPQDVGSSWTSGGYQYDGSGNIKAIGTDAYVYDAAGRITSGTAGAGLRQDYTYDGFGNVLTVTTDNDTANKIELGVDRQTNQASKPDKNAYGGYDLAGNMTSFAGSATFVYDGLGMITDSTISGERKVYLYTPDDERIAAIWIVDGAEARSEWTLRGADQKVLRRFVRSAGKWSWDEDYIYRGGQLLAAEVNRPEKTLRFHPDHLGTPPLITGNGGAEVSRHTYYPFGREVAPSPTDTERLKFTGHERDRANLDYMHARYYTPMWGRFLSVDPGSSDLRQPQTWNRYVYAENNSMLKVDPDGKLSNPVTGEQGKGKPIVHRGGGHGQIRELRSSVKASAGGEYGATRAGGRTHKGVDIIAPGGRPLVAAFSGTAEVRPEYDKEGKQNKLGLTVVVYGKDGTTAMYAHLSEASVKDGDKVKEGQQVGEAGRTGNVMTAQPANEDHVHFQLYHKKKLTDPEEFLNDPEKQKQFSDKPSQK